MKRQINVFLCEPLALCGNNSAGIGKNIKGKNMHSVFPIFSPKMFLPWISTINGKPEAGCYRDIPCLTQWRESARCA
jgi:hypothetical protein